MRERFDSAATLPRLAVMLLLAGLAAGFAVSPAQAIVMQPPGSRVALNLPVGYEPSDLFTGFVNQATGAAIIILEIPASGYEVLANGLTPDALAGKGVTAVKAGRLDRSGEYLYMTAEQSSLAGTFAKYFVLFREADVTALVSANIPKDSVASGETRSEDVERMLASAHLAPSIEAAKPLYVLGYSGPFKDAGVFLGRARLYTTDGKMQPPQVAMKQPNLIVAPSLDKRKIQSLDTTGRLALAGLDPERDVQAVEARELAIGGLKGVEHISPPGMAGAGEGSGIYQAILAPEGGGYFRIVGTAPAAE